MVDKQQKRDDLIVKLKSKGGRTAAINAMCASCLYDPEALGAGSWRQQVADCTALDCPLYPYRPMPIGNNDSDD